MYNDYKKEIFYIEYYKEVMMLTRKSIVYST